MSMLKLKAVACAALVLVALLPAGSQVAKAEMIYLQCRAPNGTQMAQEGGMFTVDLVNNTVNNGPATINTTIIDWVTTRAFTGAATGTQQYRYQLDRTTGSLRADRTDCVTGYECRTYIESYTCSKISKPATKF